MKKLLFIFLVMHAFLSGVNNKDQESLKDSQIKRESQSLTLKEAADYCNKLHELTIQWGYGWARSMFEEETRACREISILMIEELENLIKKRQEQNNDK